MVSERKKDVIIEDLNYGLQNQSLDPSTIEYGSLALWYLKILIVEYRLKLQKLIINSRKKIINFYDQCLFSVKENF